MINIPSFWITFQIIMQTPAWVYISSSFYSWQIQKEWEWWGDPCTKIQNQIEVPWVNFVKWNLLASDTQLVNFNRGVDAPESQMPYGKEAKDELAKLVQGKCLRIDVYNIDHFGRHVGDIYCNGVFIQEKLLKRGFAWHFEKHDKRPEFAKVISSCFLLNHSILSSFL